MTQQNINIALVILYGLLVIYLNSSKTYRWCVTFLKIHYVYRISLLVNYYMFRYYISDTFRLKS